MASNPVFNAEAFERAQNSARAVQPMTLQGTIGMKSFREDGPGKAVFEGR